MSLLLEWLMLIHTTFICFIFLPYKVYTFQHLQDEGVKVLEPLRLASEDLSTINAIQLAKRFYAADLHVIYMSSF